MFIHAETHRVWHGDDVGLPGVYDDNAALVVRATGKHLNRGGYHDADGYVFRRYAHLDSVERSHRHWGRARAVELERRRRRFFRTRHGAHGRRYG